MNALAGRQSGNDLHVSRAGRGGACPARPGRVTRAPAAATAGGRCRDRVIEGRRGTRRRLSRPACGTKQRADSATRSAARLESLCAAPVLAGGAGVSAAFLGEGWALAAADPAGVCSVSTTCGSPPRCRNPRSRAARGAPRVGGGRQAVARPRHAPGLRPRQLQADLDEDLDAFGGAVALNAAPLPDRTRYLAVRAGAHQSAGGLWHAEALA